MAEETIRASGWPAPAESESFIRLERLPQHRHKLTPAIRQGKRNDLLRVPAPVHVADDLVRLPAHMLQVLSAHVKRPDNPAALGAVVRRLAGPAGRGHGRAYAEGRRRGGD